MEHLEKKFETPCKKEFFVEKKIEKYLQEINLDDLLKTDYKIITDLNKQNFESYEKLLKSYFQTKVESKTEERSEKIKIQMIQNHPRFRYYCLLREIMDIEACNPETFL